MKRLIVVIIFILIIGLSKSTYCLDFKNQKSLEQSNFIENVLLIGKDGFNKKEPSRSDSIIILSIDKLNKSLKLTSIARDTLVYIPDKGYEKINHAYAYGKEKLLLDTINKNFKLNITDYAIVDFNSFIEVVDILGGVEINVNECEIEPINDIVNSCYSLNTQNKGNIKYINSSGNQVLNGYQALAYARIRKADSIYKRDERQRKLLSSVAKKLSHISIGNYAHIVNSILNHIDINISFDKVIKLAFLSYDLSNYEIKQLQFPVKEYRQDGVKNEEGLYVIKWNEEKNLEILHKFIYNN